MPPHTRARVCAESLAPSSEPDRRVLRSYRHTRRAMTTTIAAKMNQAMASSLSPRDGCAGLLGDFSLTVRLIRGRGAPVERALARASVPVPAWPDSATARVHVPAAAAAGDGRAGLGRRVR